MKAYLLGLACVYALQVGAYLYLDEAVRPNNPWVLSFVLSGLMVPLAAGWAGAELGALVFRRRTLEPGRSAAWRRAVRGGIAGSVGTLGAMTLLTVVGLEWDDYYIMALASGPASLVVSVIGRRGAKRGVCGACGYDLRGLTAAAGGKCPECGEIAADLAVGA